jgi:hypothetical protein
MSIYKEDINESKERLKAWWDHELVDRPCFSYWTPKPGESIPVDVDLYEYFDPWYLAQNWDNIDACIKDFETTCKYLHFGGEGIPRLFLNYGAGALVAAMGIEPRFLSQTVWFERETAIDEVVNLLESVKLDNNNPWYQRYLKITEIAAKHARTNYNIGLIDIGAPLDMLNFFLGPKNLILGMKRKPHIIDMCRGILLEKIMCFFNDLQTIIERYSDGCNTWMDIWCPKRWYPIQSDVTALLSPEWFRRFALPDIITQAESLDYSIYHLDGPDALKYIDDLLKVDAIDGIQWVPGAGRELQASDKWMPLYKKIQAAQKSVVLGPMETHERIAHFYKELNPKFLHISALFDTYCRGQYYIPKFVGGQGGEGDYQIFMKDCRAKVKLLKQQRNEKMGTMKP